MKHIFSNADIESKLKRIEEDPEGSGTAHLFNIIQGVSVQANRAFQSLFERQVCDFSILNSSVAVILEFSVLFIFVLAEFCRLKQKRLGLSKECYRSSGQFSTCQVQSVVALARENMIWQLGSTRRPSQSTYHFMYKIIFYFVY